jgi:hypothetical protein
MMDTLATPRIDALAGLLESYEELKRLQGRLRSLRCRLEQVRCYLATPGANRPLGRAQLERVRARYAATHAGLREARREAHRRLSLAGPADRHRIA